MSERARAFVEEWISNHVDAKDADGDIEARAKTLASQCLADASKFRVQKLDIKGCVVDHQGRVADKSEKFACDVREPLLVCQKFVR